MPLELPPSQVVGQSPYFDKLGLSPNQMLDVMATSPGYWLLMQQAADEEFRADKYKEGDWQSALNSALLWDEKEAMTAFEKAAVADCLVAKGVATVAEAIWSVTPYAEIVKNFDGELSGGVYTPVAALFHSLAGGGSPMWTKMSNLGLHFELDEFTEIRESMQSAGQGVTPLSIDKVKYDTGNDSIIAKYFLGNVTLKVEGEITKVGEQATFVGTAKGWNDVYDGNASNHRPELLEHATKLLDLMQTHTPASSYEIKLVGELPIEFSLAVE